MDTSTPNQIPPQPMASQTYNRSTDRWLVALALLGTALMGYLSYLHFKTGPSSFCNFGAGFSCDLVNKSTFAEVRGVPVSFLGLGYFAFVGALVWRKFLGDHLRVILLATVASLAFSLYLTYVELFILDSICVFCEASKLTMLVILVLTVRAMRKAGQAMRFDWIAGAAAAGAAFTAAVVLLRDY